MDSDYLTLKEAAAYLRLSEGWLYKLVMWKKIPFYKPVKKLYFKKEELNEYIVKNKKG